MLKSMIRTGALATALAVGSFGLASGAMAQDMHCTVRTIFVDVYDH